MKIDSSGEIKVPAGIGTQIRFENQHNVTADAAISTFDDGSGTLLCLGSNFFLNSSGSESRYNTSEESAGIIINRNGTITFNTNTSGGTATPRMRIDDSGNVFIAGTAAATAKHVFYNYGGSNFYYATSNATFSLADWQTDVGGTKTNVISFKTNGSANLRAATLTLMVLVRSLLKNGTIY